MRPVKRVDGLLLVRCEGAACALVELMQIGKTGSCTDSVASFRLRRFVVWSLPLTRGAKEKRNDGDQLRV